MGEIVYGFDGAAGCGAVWMKSVDGNGDHVVGYFYPGPTGEPDTDDPAPLSSEWKNVGHLTEDDLTWPPPAGERGSTRSRFARALDQALGGGTVEVAGQLTANEVTLRWQHIIDRLATTDPDAAQLASDAFERWRAAAATNWPGVRYDQVEPVRVEAARRSRDWGQGCRKDGHLADEIRAAQLAQKAWLANVRVEDLQAELRAEEESRIRRWYLNGGGD